MIKKKIQKKILDLLFESAWKVIKEEAETEAAITI